jgi:hypothetical protein
LGGRGKTWPGIYFFLGARCERAEAAAVFDALLVRPSRKTFDAAFAAFADVCRCLATLYPSQS